MDGANAKKTLFDMQSYFGFVFCCTYSRFPSRLIPCNVLHAAVVVVDAVGAQDLCDTPSEASAQNVIITGNHRGICEYRQTGSLIIWYRQNDQPNELCVAAIVA